jgi:NADP-dependent 3-hydroxy acid dehydrogenase YdfG
MKKAAPSLSGKTVVITGASSGVGRATAIAFAKKGANLVLAARGADALQSIADSCTALGVRAIPIQTDMTIAKEVTRLAEQALQLNGRIDIWVNNAGVLALGALDEMPADVIDGVIKTNLLGYLHGARAVLPVFKKQQKGTLINNISIGGWVAAPYGAAYTASKYGLRGMVEALQGEVNTFPHIHICALYPGFQDTPGVKHAANYLGVQPANPPLNFNPNRLAAAIVNVALRPTTSTYPDWSAVLARGAYALFPGLTRTIMAGLMRLAQRKGTPSNTYPGNVLHPVAHDMRIQAKTSSQRIARKAKMLTAAAIGATVLWMVMRPKMSSKS